MRRASAMRRRQRRDRRHGLSIPSRRKALLLPQAHTSHKSIVKTPQAAILTRLRQSQIDVTSCIVLCSCERARGIKHLPRAMTYTQAALMVRE